MRILALSNSKILCSSLKLISIDYFEFKFDCVENITDFKYYIGIRNYDYVIINSSEIDVENELLDELIKLTDNYKKTQLIYVKTKGEGILNNLDRAKLISKGVVFSTDEDDYIKDYIESVFNSFFRIYIKDSVLKEGKLLVDVKNKYVFYDDSEIFLEEKPIEVLAFLFSRKGQIVTREELLHSIWDDPELVTPNVVDVCVKLIRDKVDKRYNISTIETVYRRGLRFIYSEN